MKTKLSIRILAVLMSALLGTGAVLPALAAAPEPAPAVEQEELAMQEEVAPTASSSEEQETLPPQEDAAVAPDAAPEDEIRMVWEKDDLRLLYIVEDEEAILVSYEIAEENGAEAADEAEGWKVALPAEVPTKDKETLIPVTAIGEAAFAGWEKLASIALPESIAQIGEDAFADCEGLAEVFWERGEEEAAQVEIKDGNAALTEAEQIYDVTIEEDGTVTLPASPQDPQTPGEDAAEDAESGLKEETAAEDAESGLVEETAAEEDGDVEDEEDASAAEKSDTAGKEKDAAQADDVAAEEEISDSALQEDSVEAAATETAGEGATEQGTATEEADSEEEAGLVSEEAANSWVPADPWETPQIYLDETSIELYPGDKHQLHFRIVPENAAYTSTQWTSLDPDMVTVSGDGTLQAMGIPGGTAVCLTLHGEGYPSREFYCSVHILPSEVRDEDRVSLANGIWVGGFVPEMTYTGKALTQEVRVYDHHKLLAAGKDYAISYKNNTNASVDENGDPIVPDDKMPTMQVKMKGQYAGTYSKTFRIAPKNLLDSDVVVTNDRTTLPLKVKGGYPVKQLPKPVVKYNGKTLAQGKDFEVVQTAFMPGAYADPGSWMFNIEGRGNYQGMRNMYYTILNPASGTLDLTKASVKYNTSLVFAESLREGDGNALSLGAVREALDVRVNKGAVAPDQYEVILPQFETGMTPQELDAPGKYDLLLQGAGGCAGSLAKTFQIKAKPINKTFTLDKNEGVWQDEVSFDQGEVTYGNGMTQASGAVTLRDETGRMLVEGRDYKISYKNNAKVGKATLVVTGTGWYSGSLSLPFQITGAGSEIYVDYNGLVVVTDPGDPSVPVWMFYPYRKGGIQPTIAYVMDGNPGMMLQYGKDYTVKLTAPKGLGTATLTVTGKGNFAGAKVFYADPLETDEDSRYKEAESFSFDVSYGSIANCQITVPDKELSEKEGAWKSVPVVTDADGKKLKLGTDFVIDESYDGDGYWIDGTGETPKAGETVNVRVKGIGNYTGILTGSYHIFAKKQNISALQIVIDDQYYTGREVKPEPHAFDTGAIHVYLSAADKKAGKEVENASEYVRVLSYANNVKAGTAKVTLQGHEDKNYGGTKTYSFKIKKRSGVVATMVMMEGFPTFTMNAGETKKLAAVVLPEDAGDKTLRWTSSDPDVATVDAKGTVKAVGSGTATITATAAENEHASATWFLNVFAPVRSLTAVGGTTQGVALGGTKQLEVAFTPADASDKTVLWESLDPETVSVDDSGLIKGLRAGTARVTATSANNTKAKVTFTITVSGPTGLSLSETALRGEVGGSVLLEASILPEGVAFDDLSIEWRSGNDAVATVDENGMVSLHSPGTALIRAEVPGAGFGASCLVIVNGEADDATPIGNVINALDYGATPGDATDDTSAIREALGDVGAGDTLYIPSGTYRINAVTGGIDLKSNMKLLMDDDTVLEAIPNSSESYRIVQVFVKENVTISGGHIKGERRQHTGSSGEYGHGLYIATAQNVTVSGVTISDCWGDGIYIGNNAAGTKSDGIVIRNCIVDNSRRNGLALVRADNVTIEGSEFKNTNGKDPQAGILNEPNKENGVYPVNRHVVITNTKCTGNTNWSFGSVWPNYPNTPPITGDDFFINECTMSGGKFGNHSVTNMVIRKSNISNYTTKQDDVIIP